MEIVWVPGKENKGGKGGIMNKLVKENVPKLKDIFRMKSPTAMQQDG